MKIAVIDFVSRFSDDVRRTLEEIGVEYEFFDPSVGTAELKDFDAMIFTGSLETVYDGGTWCDISLLQMGLPILGICYGHQLIHHLLGGEARRSETPESGPAILRTEDSLLFKGLPKQQKVEMHHDDEVGRMAEGFEKIAETDGCRYAATQNVEKKIYTVQFHPEAEENDYGKEIFLNFIDICR